MLFRPQRQPSVDYDCIQMVKGLAHSYVPVVGGIKSATKWSDSLLGDAGRQCTSVEAVGEGAGEKDSQHPDHVTAAIVHGDMMCACSILQQLSRPGLL